MRLLLTCAAMALGLTAASAHAQFSVGPNVNITKLAGNQAEGAIAVDPTNPLRLFAFSNPSSGSNLTGSVSSNGGATWATRTMATGSDGLAAACCDPSCAFDAFGNLFICYINSAVNAIIVGMSTNGGASFTQIGSFSGSVDQPTLTVGAGTVWVTYNLSGTINARGATITGLGTVGAFTAAQAVPSGAGNFGDIAIGPAGQVIVAYENPSGGQGPANIIVSLDANGLAAGGFAAATTATATNVGGFDFITPQPNRSVDAEAGFAWDRSGGPFNGRLYMVYTEEPVNESNDTDVMLRISNNNGVTWGAPVRVHDANTKAQFLPRIAMDQATGHFAIIWYDARNDAANVRSEIWGTASIDGGATFLPNVKISTGASQSTTAGSGIDFGDYIGLTMHNDSFWPIWADNSNSTGDNPNGVNAAFDQYTAKVTILFGSCCITGSCTRTLQSACTGSWTVSGACSPNPCPQPTGSCCLTGVCSVTTQAACAGAWTLAGICSPNPCPPVVPANDTCAAAATLSLGVTATGTNLGATTDTTIVDTTICGQGSAANSSLDVFWTFTAPATANYTVDTCGSTFDTVLTVHSACPATDANKIACNDDSSLNTACASGNLQSRIPSVTLTAGATYTIRVAGFNGATGAVSVTINPVTPLGACCAITGCSPTDAANCAASFIPAAVCSPYPCPAPVNDQCSGALPLSLGVPVSATSLAATTDTTIVDTTICGQATAASSSADVFWSFTAPATATYTVDTCGSAFDTVLTVHSACPATDANKIACNDDSGINTPCANSGLSSRIPSVTLSAGSTYTIRVAGYNGGSGTYVLQVNLINPIGACCNLAACSVTDAPNCPNTFTVGAACSPNSCLAITGACCTGTHCTLATIPGCAGVFQGFGVLCGAPDNPTTCCPANFNQVDGINVQDIFDFLSAWFSGQPAADFNHVGGINVQDIFDFLAAWFAGCN
jgi:hypothetical protein